MVEFKFQQYHKAINVAEYDDMENDLPKFKEYQQGQSVKGRYYYPKTDEAKERYKGDKKFVLLDEAYVVPMSVVKVSAFNQMPNELKNATGIGKGLGERLQGKARYYALGGLIGAVSTGLGAFYLKSKKPYLWAIGGGLFGAHVAFQLAESNERSGFITDFNNFIKKNK